MVGYTVLLPLEGICLHFTVSQFFEVLLILFKNFPFYTMVKDLNFQKEFIISDSNLSSYEWQMFCVSIKEWIKGFVKTLYTKTEYVHL